MTDLVSSIVNRFGLVQVTLWAISFFSTLSERLLLFVLCLAVLTAAYFLSRNASPRLKGLAPILTSLLLFLGLYLIFRFDKYPFPVDGYLFPGNHPVVVAMALTTFVAGGLWLFRGMVGKLLVLCIASGVAVFLVNGWSLRGLARVLHADKAVGQFATGDFNWLEFDSDHGTLIATGGGQTHLLAFDTNALGKEPRRSTVEVGGAVGFGFNRAGREVYVFNGRTKTLFILDAGTLAPKTTYPVPEITPGDGFASWDQATGQIFITSEEEDNGAPTVAVDRNTGKVKTLDFVTYNLFHHPSKPVLYFSLSNDEAIGRYDATSDIFTARFPANRRQLDRVITSPDERELFVSDVVGASVIRLDAETLDQKGTFKAARGVRTFAVDGARNMLLAGGLLANVVEVIDLQRHCRIGKYYVGPWLRSIVVDPRSAIAYISSIEGLFRLDYSGLNGSSACS